MSTLDTVKSILRGGLPAALDLGTSPTSPAQNTQFTERANPVDTGGVGTVAPTPPNYLLWAMVAIVGVGAVVFIARK